MDRERGSARMSRLSRLAPERSRAARARTRLHDRSVHESLRFRRGEIRELIDRVILYAHVPRDCVQARAVTAGTFARFLFLDPFRLALGREFIFQNRIAIVALSRLQILVPDFSKATAFLACA